MSTMTTFVHPTPDSTRDDLALSMSHLCTQAKELRRRGYQGTASQRYADLHANLDVLITSWEQVDRRERAEALQAIAPERYEPGDF